MNFKSSVSLESGYASHSDLHLRANSQSDNQNQRSNDETTVQECEGNALTSGSNEGSKNHPEEKIKRGMDKHPHFLHAVQEQSPPLSPNLEGHCNSRDSTCTPHLSDDRESPLPSSQQQSTDDHESSVNQIHSEEEARQKLEVIAGQSMEVVGRIKRELSTIRSGWSDPSGHIEELEQLFSRFIMSLDSFNLKVTKGQEQSPSSDTNSRSCTELPNKACDQEVILWLVNKVTKWKFIGRRLGLEDTVLSRIETQDPKDVREQCYQMFQQWKSTDPKNFTYIVLGDALRKESLELFNEYVKKVSELSMNKSH